MMMVAHLHSNHGHLWAQVTVVSFKTNPNPDIQDFMTADTLEKWKIPPKPNYPFILQLRSENLRLQSRQLSVSSV